MNIKREFLYNEEKILPIQLLRTNYGISDANPTTSVSITSSIVSANLLSITFPQGSSNVAILIDSNTDEIVDVRATQPGESIITLTIYPENTYNIYIISREYMDGYINDQYRVSDPISANRATISTSDTPPAIHLEEVGAMISSKGRNDDEWYGYSDTYKLDYLQWDSPKASDGTGGKYTYLLYLKDIIGDMLNCFNVEFPSNLFNTTDSSFDTSIRIIAGHDNLVKYVRKLEADITLTNIQQIDDILKFLNAPQNLKPNYVTDTNEIHNILEGCIALSVFGCLDTNVFSDQSQRSILLTYNNHQEEIWLDPYDQYASDVGNRVGNIVMTTSYKRLYQLASEIFGECNKAVPLPINGGIWDAEGGTGGDTVRHYLTTSLANVMNSKHNEFNTKLTQMGWSSLHPYGDSTQFEESINSFASHIRDNIYSWLLLKRDEIDTDISNAGDSIFFGTQRQTITGITTAITSTTMYDVIGYGNLISTSIPSWFTNTSVSWRDISSNGTTEIASGSYTAQEVWNKLINGYTGSVALYTNDGRTQKITPYSYPKIITPSYSNFLRSYSPDLDGPDGGINGWRKDPNSVYYSRLANWTPVYDMIKSHISDLYQPITSARTVESVVTAITSTTIIVTGNTNLPSGITTSTLQVAHEATLQNIRYIKNLINSMDENMWAAHTNTNSLILSTLIQMKNKMAAEPAKSTITNITSSFVRDGVIEILWKKSTDESWSTDGIQISSIENDVKILNLESLTSVGKYFILLRPKKSIGTIIDAGDGVITAAELNEDTPNYYYGYNAQILKDDGTPVEIGTRVIVESYRDAVDRQYIRLSPIIQSIDTYGTNHKIEVWSNEFIPVLIEVDIVEHNALTLSYSMYAKKALDTDTGMCTIFDYTGNPYKVLSFGKYSNAGTAGHIIEYRIPIEDENKP